MKRDCYLGGSGSAGDFFKQISLFQMFFFNNFNTKMAFVLTVPFSSIASERNHYSVGHVSVIFP